MDAFWKKRPIHKARHLAPAFCICPFHSPLPAACLFNTRMDLAWFSTGIYSVSGAARVTGVSAGRIRRWLRGYHYRAGDKQRALPPLWRGQWPPIHGNLALGFQDLIEIRFVDAFLKQGASWAAIHRARERAAELFRSEERR